MTGGRKRFEIKYRDELRELDTNSVVNLAGLTEKEEAVLRMLQSGYDRETIAYRMKLTDIEHLLYPMKQKLITNKFITEDKGA